MNITWHGEGMVKISGKTDVPVTLVFDPFSEKETGVRPPRPQADVVLISSNRPESNHTESIPGTPVIVRTPGEYDIKGVTIRGIPAFHDSVQGKKYGQNIIYIVDLEDITICHLGCLGHTLSERQIDDIGDVDVLLVPIGGDRTLDIKGAVEVVGEIEPRLVIPTHYAIPKLKYKLASVEGFLKEMGASKVAPESKLKIKRSDLPRDETRTVLLAKE